MIEQNPYTPPENAAADPAVAAARPIAVWLLLLVMLLLVFFSALGTLGFVLVAASGFSTTPDHAAVFIRLASGLTMVGILVTVMAGIFRRKQWGRWVGLLAVVSLALISVFGHDSTRYAGDAERAGGHFARMVLIPSLLAWWAYAFAFSAKAKQYFARPKQMG